MLKRVIVAVVGVPFLLLVLVWAPEWATMVLLSGMCGLGAFELMRAVAGEKGKCLLPMTVFAAALVPVCLYAMSIYTRTELGISMGLPLLPFWLPLLALLFVFLLFLYAITHYGKENAIPFGSLTAALFSGLIFPVMLSCLLMLRMVPYMGKIMVFIPLCISFGSDTCAYFAGLSLGRHKLAPVVSPNKTVEGALGGIGAAMAGMLIYAMVLRFAFGFDVNFGLAILYGAFGSVAGVFGDLCFSVIKRQTGIKDYGNLIPGHGGVLDRFDSMMMVAPLMEALLLVLPFAV